MEPVRSSSQIWNELYWLGVLALPVACISWTITKEEILREPREWLESKSQTAKRWWQRKICYAFTCEYCFSHYVAAAVVALTGFTMVLEGWLGYGIAWLALVAVANVYLSSYSRLRVEIKKEKTAVERHEEELRQLNSGAPEEAAGNMSQDAPRRGKVA